MTAIELAATDGNPATNVVPGGDRAHDPAVRRLHERPRVLHRGRPGPSTTSSAPALAPLEDAVLVDGVATGRTPTPEPSTPRR